MISSVQQTVVFGRSVQAQHSTIMAESGSSLRAQTRLGYMKKADARGCGPVFAMCKRSERQLRAPISGIPHRSECLVSKFVVRRMRSLKLLGGSILHLHWIVAIRVIPFLLCPVLTSPTRVRPQMPALHVCYLPHPSGDWQRNEAGWLQQPRHSQ